MLNLEYREVVLPAPLAGHRIYTLPDLSEQLLQNGLPGCTTRIKTLQVCENVEEVTNTLRAMRREQALSMLSKEDREILGL